MQSLMKWGILTGVGLVWFVVVADYLLFRRGKSGEATCDKVGDQALRGEGLVGQCGKSSHNLAGVNEQPHRAIPNPEE